MGFPPVPGFVYIIPCDLSLYLYRLINVVQTETMGLSLFLYEMRSSASRRQLDGVIGLGPEISWLRTI